ncbi:MAG: hypothetical protein A2542_01480 [Parcubacteria group bacterium RIFOXYD2_FULL_52_8]|nr:MAG: hypothetical protein A2542_01480 [Parcubacteria group bacterium RIFOXYD2_FULL_52_8]
MKSRNLRLFPWICFLKGLYWFTPIFSLFLLADGVSLAVIVAANVAWSLGAFLGEMPTGIFADKYGQKLSMVPG